jgi:hypothetical protein
VSKKPKESYIEKIIKAGLLKPGSVTHVTVYHDDNCPGLKPNGICTCNPDIKNGKPGKKSQTSPSEN